MNITFCCSYENVCEMNATSKNPVGQAWHLSCGATKFKKTALHEAQPLFNSTQPHSAGLSNVCVLII